MNELLTFEWDKDRQLLEIHGNKSGLITLKNKIDYLLKNPEDNHCHLSTYSWGGGELSEEKQGAGNELIQSVKIFKWPD